MQDKLTQAHCTYTCMSICTTTLWHSISHSFSLSNYHNSWMDQL